MPATSSEARRRFTVDEVYAMAEAGILGDERVELLGGELWLVSPQSPDHATVLQRLRLALEHAYAGIGHLRPQLPLLAGAHDLPEPDLAVVRGPIDSYSKRHPGGPDALLVVEIARSSTARDRRKAHLYARAGVPAYWLVDLGRRCLEVHDEPADGRYRRVRSVGPDEAAALPGLEGQPLSLGELFSRD